MRALSAQGALEAWERGQSRGAWDRALVLLSVALPELGWRQLSELSIGQRDALLCRLREMTFGPEVRGSAPCPRCRARLEFPVDLRDFDVAAALDGLRSPEWFLLERYKVLFRLPDTRDLTAVAEYSLDAETGRRILLDRCVLKASHKGRWVKASELPESLIEALGLRMEELDPMAELPLVINCARCTHQWQVLFDVSAFLWDEIAVAAQRLLYEIHSLASAYGWTEAEILKLSSARRRAYLSQVRPAPRPEPEAAEA